MKDIKYRVTKRLEATPNTNCCSIGTAHTGLGCYRGHINLSYEKPFTNNKYRRRHVNKPHYTVTSLFNN